MHKFPQKMKHKSLEFSQMQLFSRTEILHMQSRKNNTDNQNKVTLFPKFLSTLT
jgi:hypothetical protein